MGRPWWLISVRVIRLSPAFYGLIPSYERLRASEEDARRRMWELTLDLAQRCSEWGYAASWMHGDRCVVVGSCGEFELLLRRERSSDRRRRRP
jgi:hypothetical protein